jgi:hypothetical protein
MSRRSSRLFEISLVAILMATYLYAALSESHNFGTEWFIRDDAFYYFKVAQNITEGRGITFDGVNPTNGYHPLWMLICIPIFALARFDLILPLRVLVVVSGAISAATGVLLFRLVKRTLSPQAAVLAATYWCFDRFIHYNVTMFGLETGLTALTMVALLLAMSNLEPDDRHKPLSSRQLLTLGLLAVAMIFSRLDTIFVALLAGAWILLRGTPIRYYLFFDLAIIVFSAFTSIALRTGLPAYFVYIKSAIALAALGALIQIPSFYLFGLYEHPSSAKSVTNHQSPISNYYLRFTLVSLLSAGSVALGLIGLSAAGQLEGLPRSALLVYAGFVFVGAGALRVVSGQIGNWTNLSGIRENWRQWLREGIHFYGILGGALAVYMIFNKIMFGTFTPVSGQIKHWWGSLQGSTYGNPIASLSGFLGLEREEGLNAWGPAVYALQDLSKWLGNNLWLALALTMGLAFLIFATRPRRAARAGIFLSLPVLLAGSILQMFYYNGQGYSGAKDWYWVSQMLMFTLLGALLFDLLLRPLRRFSFRSSEGQILVWILTAFVCVGIYAYPLVNNIVRRMPWGPERAHQPYLDAAAFLESNTEAGAFIGMTGGGNVSYFLHGRTIVNMDGLINSYAYFQALQAGRADAYLASMGMDYIFSNPDILQHPPYNGQFDEWSGKVGEFGHKDLLHLR